MDFHVVSRRAPVLLAEVPAKFGQERDEEMLQRAEQRFSRAPRLEEIAEIAEALEMLMFWR